MELHAAVDKHLKGRIPLSAKRALRGRLLLYTFRGPISVTDLRNYVDTNAVPFDLLGFRKSLATNGDLLLGSKPYLYSCIAHELGKAASFSADQCCISKKEASVLRDTVSSYPRLEKTLRGFVRAGYKVLTPDQLRRLASEVLLTKDYEDYVGKFVHRKMSFLIQSFGYTAKDLINDLKMASYQAILRTYPAFNDYTHVLRLAKVKARNTGMNIIHHATTAGRQRLTRDNQPLLVPLQILESNGGNVLDQRGTVVHQSYLVVGRSGTRTTDEELDVQRSIEELLDSPKFTAKQKTFLRIMVGQPNVGFTLWLKEPNEEAIERLPYDKYLVEACSYLSIDLKAAHRFLHRLSTFF